MSRLQICDFSSGNPERAMIKTCRWCAYESVIYMTEIQYEKWYNQDSYVQDIFPHVSKEEREILISGTHPICWNEMFVDIEEEDEDDIEHG